MTYSELNKKYNDFKNKYNGKVVDYDGAYGGQCWDLAQKYLVDYLKVPASVLAGCGYVGNMLKEPKISVLLKYFDEVPTTDMWSGDLVIWEKHHIAIFDNWNGKYCTYLTQNPGATHLGQCNISGKVRAFRLKGLKNDAPKEEPKKETTTKYKVGDKVNINGVYTSSTSDEKLAPARTSGVITQIIAGVKNPYLLDDGKLGWVNDACIVTNTKPVDKTIKVGDMVKIKKGAKSYDGVVMASHIYNKKYRVDELNGNRAVLDAKGLCTAFNIKDLIK